MTIEVTAAPRTITTAGSVAISVPIATEGGVDLDPATVTTEGSPTIAYTNPAGNGAARISAQLVQIDDKPTADLSVHPTLGPLEAGSGWELGGIRINISLAAAAEDRDETVPATTAPIRAQFFSTPALTLSTGDLLTGIPDDVDRAATAIVYAISGQQPVSAASNALTIAFTIEDN